jgi:DNA-binding NarL/FixJ family response regulator
MHDEVLYAELALHAGARGYVMKDEQVEQILAAIRKVRCGGISVSDATASRLLAKQTRGYGETPVSPIERLTDRELQVFQMIGQWKGTRIVAEELHLSIKTVESYREQIKQKLNLKSAAELMQLARYWMDRELVA